MKVQFSIASVIVLTTVAAALTAICTMVPTIDGRPPTTHEVAIRLAWSAPLAIGITLYLVQRWKWMRRK